MFTRTNIIKAIKACLSVGLGAFCAHVFAGSYEENSASLYFYKTDTSDTTKHFFQTDLIPIQLMDDKSLFLSAEAERDQSMSKNQRILNNRWLVSNKRNTFNGTRALREFFKMNFFNMMFPSGTDSKEFSLTGKPLQKTNAFSDIDNYRLNISDNRIALKYIYRFSL